MARPRSDDKRSAVLAAAIDVIAAQGLSAPTAAIARRAGVSNGSLFTYFETKGELLNTLYVELKMEMAAASLDGMPDGDARAHLEYAWTHWLRWATASPQKRRALAHLGVAEELTAASRSAGSQAMAGSVRLIELSRKDGPMRNAPLMLVAGMMNAMAEATIEIMLQDPANADSNRRIAFEALWRMIA